MDILNRLFPRRDARGNSGEPGAGLHRVPGNSPRSIGIGWCRASDVVAGAAGHVVPAQRALSIDPARLLREE